MGLLCLPLADEAIPCWLCLRIQILLNHDSRSGGTFSFCSSMGLLHPPLADKVIPHWLCLWIWIFCLNHNSRSGGTFSFHSSMGSLCPPLVDKVIPCWLLCLQFITLTINNYDEVLTI